MELHVVNTGFFKLDGGAMFGVVPKVLWEPINPPDENNLCTWAMRSLLIVDGNRRILVDNGIGDKQGERFLSRYGVHGDDSLLSGLQKTGFAPQEITDVFLTHLHFDHCGGGVYRDGDALKLTFPNAKYWSNHAHWKWATQPNARERASFLRENLLPVEESGHLHFADKDSASPFSPLFDILYVSGHTEHMMVPKINYKGNTICYMADLLPSVGHIPLPYVMAYDTRPLVTLEEKKIFLNEAADKQYVLFLEHDPQHECCTVKHTDKGVRLDKVFPLAEVL